MPLIEESQDEEDPVAYRYVFRVFYFFKINLRLFVLISSSIYILIRIKLAHSNMI